MGADPRPKGGLVGAVCRGVWTELGCGLDKHRSLTVHSSGGKRRGLAAPTPQHTHLRPPHSQYKPLRNPRILFESGFSFEKVSLSNRKQNIFYLTMCWLDL